jgi:hypothetical protein
MKNQIGYLIDPKTLTISEIRSDEGIDWINVALQCDTFTGAYSADEKLPPLFLDDNGLYAEEQNFFFYRGAYEPFVNKAIAMDVDSQGRSVTPKMSIEEFAANVAFVFPIRLNGSVKFIRNPNKTKIKKLPKVAA